MRSMGEYSFHAVQTYCKMNLIRLRITWQQVLVLKYLYRTNTEDICTWNSAFKSMMNDWKILFSYLLLKNTPLISHIFICQ